MAECRYPHVGMLAPMPMQRVGAKASIRTARASPQSPHEPVRSISDLHADGAHATTRCSVTTGTEGRAACTSERTSSATANELWHCSLCRPYASRISVADAAGSKRAWLNPRRLSSAARKTAPAALKAHM
eukprot:1236421-Prymnesium_polylepis.1